ncbi:MAG: two-component sensor histidine kinase [Streptomycetaceae bacterium]|nr:two-component sensor histidine kinase [Streptomycetaceae bacterium]
MLVCVLVNAPHAVVDAMADGPMGGIRGGEPGRVLWWSATAAMLLAVVVRRRRPAAMLAVATASAAVHLAQSAPVMVVDAGVLILLYSVAAHTRRVVSLGALAGLVVLVAGWSVYTALDGRTVRGLPSTVVQLSQRTAGPDGPEEVTMLRSDPWSNTWNTVTVFGLALTAAWAVGSGARSRRAYLGQLHERAADLERERDQQAALAVAAERGRISREMHDVVAHGLSVIVIQAQGGAAALGNRPDDTRAALDTIVGIGRDSLAEMRRVLGAMDEPGDAWRPRPGLAQLPELLGRVRRTGTRVRLRVEGEPGALPSAVDLSAYRIVQEALTNTMKHADDGASADVLIAYADTELRIEIRDDGRAAAPVVPDHGGNGLRGMRERARLLGGRLTAGPVPQGGFAVRATLPFASGVRL